MGRQSIITAFDKKNAHILENEIDRIWSAVKKLQGTTPSVAVESSSESDKPTSSYLIGGSTSVPEDSNTKVSKGIIITDSGFPIGSVFIAVVATNPEALLGYGMWTKIGQGRLIVGQIGAVLDVDDLLVYLWKRVS